MELKKKRPTRPKLFLKEDDPEILELLASSPNKRNIRKKEYPSQPSDFPSLSEDDVLPKLPKKRRATYTPKDFSDALDEFDDKDLGENAPKMLKPVSNTRVLEIRPGVTQSVSYIEPGAQPLLEDDSSSADQKNPGHAGTEETALSKRMRRRLQSMFGQRSDVIIDMLEMTDTDPAAALITRTLLQTMVDVLPTIEKSVRTSKGQRGVMPLNQTVSQVRELITDLQSFKDRSNLGQTLVDRHIRPAYMDIAVQVSMIFVETENYARARMTKEDFYKFQDLNLNMKKSFSDFVMKQYQELSQVMSKSI